MPNTGVASKGGSVITQGGKVKIGDSTAGCASCCGICAVGKIDFELSGVDATACDYLACVANGLEGYKNVSVSVDGLYADINCNACPPSTTLSWQGSVTANVEYEDWHAFADACTTFDQDIVCSVMRYNITINCSVKNGAGQPRVEEAWMTTHGVGCTPGGVNFLIFWYSRSAHGGNYYVGDAIPNSHGAACGTYGHGHPIGQHVIATGGTVTITQAVP